MTLSRNIVLNGVWDLRGKSVKSFYFLYPYSKSMGLCLLSGYSFGYDSLLNVWNINHIRFVKGLCAPCHIWWHSRLLVIYMITTTYDIISRAYNLHMFYWQYHHKLSQIYPRLNCRRCKFVLCYFPFCQSWASCQIRQLVGAHAPGMPGTFSLPPRVSNPDMHHGTCLTHVPWCMPGSLTRGFLWIPRRGKTFPAFPAHAQHAILRIW